MNTIKIDHQTNAKILEFCEKTNLSKRKAIEIVFCNLTDKQIKEIMAEDVNWRIERSEIDWGNDDTEIDNDEVNISEYDDEGNRKKYDEEEDIIDFGEDDDEDEIELDDDIDMEEGWEENSAKRVRTDLCRKCGNTIEHCTCGNLDGFPAIPEEFYE